MTTRNQEKSRFQIIRLEERIAPSLTTDLIPSISKVGENVRGFHGAQNACPGLENAASHSSNPILQVQLVRHGCECACPPPPPPPISV